MSASGLNQLPEQPQVGKHVSDLLKQIRVSDSLLTQLTDDQGNYREAAARVLEQLFNFIDRSLVTSDQHYPDSKKATTILAHSVPLQGMGFLGLVRSVFIPNDTPRERCIARIIPSFSMWLTEVNCPFKDDDHQAQLLINQFCAYIILQYEKDEAARKAAIPIRTARLRAPTMPAIDTLAIRQALKTHVPQSPTSPLPTIPDSPTTAATTNAPVPAFFPAPLDQSPAPQTLTTITPPPQSRPTAFQIALVVSTGICLGAFTWTMLRRSRGSNYHTPSIARPMPRIHRTASVPQLPKPATSLPSPTTPAPMVRPNNTITADSSFLLPEDPLNSSVDVGVRNALWPHRGELASCLHTFSSPYGDQYLTLGLRYLITQHLNQGAGPWQVGAYPAHRGITISWQPGDCQHFTVSGWEGGDENHRRIIHPAQAIDITTPADDVASRRRLFHRLPQDR